ncbi:MAG: OadG family transporter subunit [Oscillospiraceae bacterium]|nr:OadG family transporter subunit [Oscillospiraceae bacterium]
MLNILPIAIAVSDSVPEMTPSFIAAMTLTGLAVVFLGLLILIVYLLLSGKVFVAIGNRGKSAKKSEAKPAASASAPAPKPAAKATVPKAAPSAPVEDEDEIAAVIAAVIAAMSAVDGKNYAVRSVKPVHRAGSCRSAWAQAGMSDVTAPFSIQ